ncbi:MAG TPA: glycine--tRNA ligase subunit beta [Acidiferrobacteraceae bacterium]|nr:glycine--tRNA ligase subunit beta [Acidiferrobacteraceae bacterium]HEX19484.1 glycine--tRNA ligase subunit beta [Acidiferrobacteraceae bacterium]
MAKKKKKTAKKKKPVAAKSRAGDLPLLFELGTEELPPKNLKYLSDALGQLLYKGLEDAGLTTNKSAEYRLFATPRRLAVLVPGVCIQQPDRVNERRGPALQAAFDADGNATRAAQGFARSCGVAIEKLERLETDKGTWLVFQQKEKGQAAKALIPDIIANALKQLPIAKRMRWGDLDVEFVRPVHWLVLLHGDKVIKTDLLSVAAGRMSYGHRFHQPRAFRIESASKYEAVLKKNYVIASFAERQQKILDGVHRLAKKQKGKALIDAGLLDEVTSLVERPEPVLGSFDKDFLQVPAEALITTMQDNQKYFPLSNSKGKLLPYFITISNIKSRKVAMVREGNERVLRARFADARFFWETDRKKRLDSHVEALGHVVFHKKLGSVLDKVQRIQKLALLTTNQIGGDVALTERAARLCKADLMTGMVGEFPELQGIMGRYYAAHDGEPDEVATAIKEHYWPRFSGDVLPQSKTGQALAIADKLDSLLGIFSVGEVPTGDKDPYGLRRAALGVLRIMIEQKLDVDLQALLAAGLAAYSSADTSTTTAVYDYMMERLRAYYRDSGIAHDEYAAVLACRPARPLDFDLRIHAVRAFRKLPEAEGLTAANKRIHNILKQAGLKDLDHVADELLTEKAEQELNNILITAKQAVTPLFNKGEYTAAMKKLAALRPAVDAFFDQVMVMVDEEAVCRNRLALLESLRNLFLNVADLSELQG